MSGFGVQGDSMCLVYTESAGVIGVDQDAPGALSWIHQGASKVDSVTEDAKSFMQPIDNGRQPFRSGEIFDAACVATAVAEYQRHK